MNAKRLHFSFANVYLSTSLERERESLLGDKIEGDPNRLETSKLSVRLCLSFSLSLSHSVSLIDSAPISNLTALVYLHLKGHKQKQLNASIVSLF